MFWLENYPEFSRFFLCGQQYLLKDTKHNALNNSNFRNQIRHLMFSIAFKEKAKAPIKIQH